MYILKIKLNTNDEDVVNYYSNYKIDPENSGIDLMIPEDYQTSIKEITSIDHKISCEMLKVTDENVTSSPFWLLPRSSIYKTKFRMANSVGLIDSGYRGPIMAKIDTLPTYFRDGDNIGFFDEQNLIKKGKPLFQIASPSLEPISKIAIVNELTDSNRGYGGFGSTN